MQTYKQDADKTWRQGYIVIKRYQEIEPLCMEATIWEENLRQQELLLNCTEYEAMTME